MIATIETDQNGDPVPGGSIERINYDGDINGGVIVNGRAGDDTFVLDDNLASMVINGDAGDDIFQIGQVFQSPRDGTNPNNGLSSEDYFETTPITKGYLSNGISHSTTINGGFGEDDFTVYRNLAELFLFGEEDDDTFTVRAFVKVNPDDPDAPFTNINGGQGADFIAFAVNAPVRIDGGDGFDTLTVIGTEFGDDFVVTADGVYRRRPLRHLRSDREAHHRCTGRQRHVLDRKHQRQGRRRSRWWPGQRCLRSRRQRRQRSHRCEQQPGRPQRPGHQHGVQHRRGLPEHLRRRTSRRTWPTMTRLAYSST